MNRHLPSDIRPQGTSNLNGLVHHQLGSQAYDVLATLQANLTWLNQLHNALPRVLALAHHTDTLDELAKHHHTLYEVSRSLPALNHIYMHLGMLTDDGEHLHAIEHKLHSVEEQLTIFNSVVNPKQLKELMDKYLEIETKLLDAKNTMDKIINNEKDIKSINKILIHLQASDATNLAVSTEKKSDIDLATVAIALSEKEGNDESINKQRLEDI